MAFRPFSSRSSGAWIDPAGRDAFRELAKSYKAIAPRVEQQMMDSAHEKLVGPAIEAGAHPAIHVFRTHADVFVGVPANHPAAAQVAEREYGSQAVPAGGHIRRTLRDLGDESFDHFQEGLAG